jgi:DNA-binding FrmR family transcriptional regulator
MEPREKKVRDQIRAVYESERRANRQLLEGHMTPFDDERVPSCDQEPADAWLEACGQIPGIDTLDEE